jgi:1-acyl-sn-glycerol-3-phosphate acyltransferase
VNTLWYIIAALRALIIFVSMFLAVMLFFFIYYLLRNRTKWAFKLRYYWLNYIAIPVLNIKIEIYGTIPKGPLLFVSNHRSFADPIALCSFVNGFVLAKAEVKKYPIINWGAMLTGVVFVDRENDQSRRKARSKIGEIIGRGYNVILYPEGTVSMESTTLPYRMGSFAECVANKISIVPVATEYQSERDLWKISNFMKQYMYQFAKPVTRIRLYFGEPMFYEDPVHFRDAVQKWTQKKLREMQKDWVKHDAFKSIG